MKYQKLSNLFGVMAMGAVNAFLLLPLVVMIYSKLVNGVEVFIHPFFFWWPFVLNIRFFKSIYIYQIYCGHACVVYAIISLQLFTLFILNISGHFYRIGERIRIIVDEFDGKNVKVFEEKLFKIIEIHRELIECSESIAKIYTDVCILHVVLGGIIICFTGFVMFVS